jgi:UDP-N-acetylmuramyl pentapeptide phosphotransferase/UDP-N-acetylglucosamine-1-phosphate transferase
MAMPVIIKIASLKRLTDAPDNGRKRHTNIVPTLGGIGIFASFLISFSVWGEAGALQSYPFFVAALFMLFMIGVKDDILVLSPLKKLFVQLIAATELVLGGGVVFTHFDGLFGIQQIPWGLGVFITIVVFVIMVNAYNLIDGIDGLAGGVGMIISLILGGWFWLSGFDSMAILAIVLFGALLGFLVFNFHPAKIFMGDTGAMAVGFILTYMVFQFIILNNAHPDAAFYIGNAPVIAIALLIIPIVDTLRVFVLRLLAKRNPLKADYNHIHHELLKSGFLTSTASTALWIGNIFAIVLAFYFDKLEANTLLIIVLLAGFMILPFFKFMHFLLLKLLPDGYVTHTSRRERGKA